MTARIFMYALADVFGLACVGIGGTWFAAGKPAILSNFPTSTAEAVACTAGGVVVMLWAMAHILREIAGQSGQLQKEYDGYIAQHHPGKAIKRDDQAPDQP